MGAAKTSLVDFSPRESAGMRGPCSSGRTLAR